MDTNKKLEFLSHKMAEDGITNTITGAAQYILDNLSLFTDDVAIQTYLTNRQATLEADEIVAITARLAELNNR